MGESEAFSLPHGARGIEAGDFVIEFRPDHDKLVLLNKTSDEHYTVQFGNVSGVFDIHRTWTDEAGNKQHQTIFAMRQEAMLPCVREVGIPLVEAFFRLLRPLRIGWLARHNIGIVKGLEPTSDEEIAVITKKTKRRRLVVVPEQLEKNSYAPEFLEELRDLPDGAFSLIDCNQKPGKKIGIGFKNTDLWGNVHLHWLKLSDLNSLLNSIQQQFLDVAMRHSIPVAEYPAYKFLRP